MSGDKSRYSPGGGERFDAFATKFAPIPSSTATHRIHGRVWRPKHSRIRFILFIILYHLSSTFLLAITPDDKTFIEEWDISKSASEKADLVWERMDSNRESEAYPGILELLIRGFLFQTDETERITRIGTFRPYEAPKKFLHTQSAFGRVKYKAVKNSSQYTGLFAEERDIPGIISFSRGSRLVGNVAPSWGMGLKLFRNGGVEAGAVFGNPTVMIGNVLNFDWNMFNGLLCNHYDLATGALLLLVARKRPRVSAEERFWTLFPHATGVSNFADHTFDNTPVETPKFPYVICLRAPLPLAQQYNGHKQWSHPADFLKDVPPGTHLYDVLAMDSPAIVGNILAVPHNTVKIGEIHTDSDIISSQWGDKHWYVQHQKLEEDIALRPEWQSELVLSNLIMDGWSAIPLYTDRLKCQTPGEVLSSLAPTFLGFIQVLVNPTAAAYFFAQNVIDPSEIEKVAENILVGSFLPPSSPGSTPRSIGASKEFKANLVPPFPFSLQDVLPTIVSLDPLFRLFLSLPTGTTSADDEPRPLGVSDGSGNSNSAEDTKLLEAADKFYKEREGQVSFDGHFIGTNGIAAFLSLVQDPLIRHVLEAGSKQYTETYGKTFWADVATTVFSPKGITNIRELIQSVASSGVLPLSTLSDTFAGNLLTFLSRTLNPYSDELLDTFPRSQSLSIKEGFRRLADYLGAPMQRLGNLQWFR